MGDGQVGYTRLVAGRHLEETAVSIIRVGLAETKKFSEGYEAIFGKKKEEAGTKTKKSSAKKKKAKKK